jgi:hypothetical protein
MKALKTLLTLVLVVGVLGGAAYAGGSLIHRHDQRQVSATGDHPGAPSSHEPADPTSAPPATPSGGASNDPSNGPSSRPTADPTQHPAQPADHVVLKAGAKGTKVRELQQRLFQLAWLPETTTGVYDDARSRRSRASRASAG